MGAVPAGISAQPAVGQRRRGERPQGSRAPGIISHGADAGPAWAPGQGFPVRHLPCASRLIATLLMREMPELQEGAAHCGGIKGCTHPAALILGCAYLGVPYVAGRAEGQKDRTAVPF